MVRTTQAKLQKEVKKGDAQAPTPSSEMQAMTDQMRNRMLLPGVYIPRSIFDFLFTLLSYILSSHAFSRFTQRNS